jgi:hypothetical protein
MNLLNRKILKKKFLTRHVKMKKPPFGGFNAVKQIASVFFFLFG